MSEYQKKCHGICNVDPSMFVAENNTAVLVIVVQIMTES